MENENWGFNIKVVGMKGVTGVEDDGLRMVPNGVCEDKRKMWDEGKGFHFKT